MKTSLFPGMDPYLEAHWPDVHGSLVIGSKNLLNQSLPDDLAASSEERVAVESDVEGEPIKNYLPDIRLFELVETTATLVDSNNETSTIPHIRLVAQMEPITERFIRITENGTDRLITVIEFLSPSNKRNPGLSDFRMKRAELLTSGVNFVEVDLVREGNWLALLRPHRCTKKWMTAYRVTVRVPSDPAAVNLYPIPLRKALPSIVIPLRQHDPKVSLDLQQLVNQAYINGRYGRRLKYSEPPEPPLDPEDQAWASELTA